MYHETIITGDPQGVQSQLEWRMRALERVVVSAMCDVTGDHCASFVRHVERCCMQAINVETFGSQPDPEAPADDLDLRLCTVYDNHKEFNKDLRDAAFQPKSLRPLNQQQVETLKSANAKSLPAYRCIGDHG
ncbi:uncharacterized protein DEA37_0003555 [Paragonimus westermani]|uniref:Uncharacterized protein n=1 Tax=Paragonimus westermani TaxID=34504 RepID=A0A5J4NDT6_9TREM|nr:uncharacterized protein DEA37_0003555 [Paragonimus westermani]